METLSNWCELPTRIGIFRMYDTGDEQLRLVSYGDINEFKNRAPLVRIHSSCIASEIFNALDCDCSDQVLESMRMIYSDGGGMIIHNHDEGRGVGLSKKIAVVRLMQDENIDTVEAFNALDLEHDIRKYSKATDLLLKLGISQVRLITNNPAKVRYVEAAGITVVETVNIYTNVRKENAEYLRSKNQKLHHNIPLNNESEMVYFHNAELPYGFLSNFSRRPIYCKGVIWDTVEHYYQAQKFEDPKIQEKIRMAETPMMAKKVAHSNLKGIVPNWSDIKGGIMYDALYAKFTQHPDLNIQLIETNTRILTEHSFDDKYWGDGGDGSGMNRLGILLMKIRDKLLNS